MEAFNKGSRGKLIRVMFVCHGNICRSPMAEFVLKDMVKKKGLSNSFLIHSSATSMEEVGNPVHYGTRNKLKKYGISVEGKKAVLLSSKDYEKYDYIIGMEERNINNIKRIMGHDKDNKIARLLDFADLKRDIADPWYTGDFDLTYEEICEGCEAFLEYCK